VEVADSLEFLEDPFSVEEIDNVIKNLPNNKSLGPDGFNNEFLKKCWAIIKHDFYSLCEDFFHNRVCLRSINSSYITLIPKLDNARTIAESRTLIKEGGP
jgi:hypothetical protein